MTGPQGRRGWKLGQGWLRPSPGGAPWSSVAAGGEPGATPAPELWGVSPGREAAPTHFHPKPGGPQEATPWRWAVGWSGQIWAQSRYGRGPAGRGWGSFISLSHPLPGRWLAVCESPRSIWTTPSAPAGQAGRTIKLSADLGSGAGRQGRGASGGPSKMSLLGGL